MAFPSKPEHFWPVVWGGVAAALAATLVLEHQYGRSTAGEGPRPPARVAEAKLLPPFRVPLDAQAGGETLARPLFVPARRPAPAATAGPGSIKRGQYVLQGTTIVGSVRIAFLKEVTTGTVHRVEKGGQIEGMTLEEVAPEKVVLRAGDDSESLPLLVAKGAGAPAAAVERGPFGSAAPGPATPVPGMPAEPAPGATGAAKPVVVPPATAAGRVAMPAAARPATQPSADESGLTPEEIIRRRRAVPRPQTRN